MASCRWNLVSRSLLLKKPLRNIKKNKDSGVSAVIKQSNVLSVGEKKPTAAEAINSTAPRIYGDILKNSALSSHSQANINNGIITKGVT